MRVIELTSIALELDAADPRVVVLQPIVREPEREAQLSTVEVNDEGILFRPAHNGHRAIALPAWVPAHKDGGTLKK